ncbi:MAG: DUF1592 domain-containing protein [Myxococcota bacterium]
MRNFIICLVALTCAGGCDSGSINAPEQQITSPVAPVVRRLTTDEYARTVRDVIGVQLSNEDLAILPVARPVEGFVHVASGQTVLPDHVRAYSVLAERIAGDAAFTAFVDQHSSCQETSSECAAAFIGSAGAALFRRPVDPDEVDLFAALFDAIIAEQGDFGEAAGATIQAMLQSPPFLYLLQAERNGSGEARALSSYELAAKLSYFLWGSTPDQALYAAAAAGELDSPDGLAAQAERMLTARDKVREGYARFVVDWARLESLPDDDGLRADRIAGAVAYYADRVESGADLLSMAGDRRVFMTPELAASYGVEAGDEGMQLYTLPDGMGPGGLLGQPGIIAGMTNSDGGEIVARGLFLMSQLFCRTPPEFPSSLQEEVDEFVDYLPDESSARAIAEARLERDSCGGCHQTFDPLGYGFERFDFQGSYRSEDEFGNPVTDDGWLPAAVTDDGVDQPYSNIDEYMSLLEESTAVKQCLMRFQVEFALGLRLDAEHNSAVEEIAAIADASGGDHHSLILAIVTHPLFRTTEVAQ